MVAVFLLQAIALIAVVQGNEHHQPFKWILGRWDDSRIIRTNETVGAPVFNVTNCDLLNSTVGYGGSTRSRECDPGRQYSWGATNLKTTYWCPSSNPGKGYCNSPGHYYCAYWGCETLTTGGWSVDNPDKFLRVAWLPENCQQTTYSYDGGINRAGTCRSLRLTILQPQDSRWVMGQTWGVRFWEPGANRGVLLFIRKEVILSSDGQQVRPNLVLNGLAGRPTPTSVTGEVPTSTIKEFEEP